MTTAQLERTAFATSRLLEFFSEKELQMQIGHPFQMWPIALVKELIDNGLDACENAGTAPDLRVILQPDAVTVLDNGPGLPVTTLERSLDYLVRVSDKAHYVAPTRGQLGNALKCVWAAPYVVTGERGQVDVTTGGTIYRVDVTLDRIAQAPQMTLTTSPDGLVKNGTAVTMHWPSIAGYLAPAGDRVFYNLADLIAAYGLFNPHASLTGPGIQVTASDPTWRKWRPSDPTCPHWYKAAHLRALIAAYLGDERAGGRARTVREFVTEFAGLSGSAKQRAVTEAAGLTGAYLHDLIDGADVSGAKVEALLTAMKAEARLVKPDALGALGEAHLTGRLVACYGCTPESVIYRKAQGITADGLPWVLEVVFGVYAGAGNRKVRIGLNWAPALRSPLHEIDALLGDARLDYSDPVALAVHLACPRPDYTDRGKSRLDLPAEISEALAVAFQTVTKTWKAAKRKADREDRVQERDLEEMRKRNRARELSVKDAAYQVMEEAYLRASSRGTLPANARQVMYAARPLVLRLTGGKCWKESSYFTQHLLPDYMMDYPDKAAGWDVVFDARGHFAEPHTRERVDLGTLAVRRYIANWREKVDDRITPPILDYAYPTTGPTHRYRFALFVEKEGFTPLLEASRIAERYDVAVMSTKGMSNTASRRLVESLSNQGVTILVARDFDKAGFTIARTLAHDTRRYQFGVKPRVIDLGLRLVDVKAMGLESEPVEYDGKVDPREGLAESGATMAEQRYLVNARDYFGRWSGQRVELNAMTSRQFVTWLEEKLREQGVKKVIPDFETLTTAYRRAWQYAQAQQALDDVLDKLERTDVRPPPDVTELIAREIDGTGTAWDEAIYRLVRVNLGGMPGAQVPAALAAKIDSPEDDLGAWPEWILEGRREVDAEEERLRKIQRGEYDD
jgi:DNA topoisomerase VI subunit B